MKKFYLLPATLMLALGANAQSWHDGDITWPEGTDFPANVSKWAKNHQITEDDNFFISRVKPRVRFQNSATQVRSNLKWNENDRRLIAWLPINTNRVGNQNSLPTGEFDSECFTLWSYVDHYGNWSCPLGAIPGNFTDVAHKNGVAVSSVAGIPYGGITDAWKNALNDMIDMDVEDAAKMMAYYGHDGLGYNSEFSGYYSMAQIQSMHEQLIANLNAQYQKVVPGYNMAENIWYDGTNSRGSIQFDNGLRSHNVGNWGPLGQERASLFFNYNWNNIERVLKPSIENAEALAGGRNPLYLYCGINMQGGEPRATSGETWGLLPDYNLSIGLWGAHNENMFWQYRGENGSSADAKQNTYQYRLENWFTGGSHNPVNGLSPVKVTTCSSTDTEFQGMSYFMSARSALKWDLSEEPFYTFFNIGNGRYFNWKGTRANDNEWYNIGIQDYLPNWRWWLSSKFLGTEVADVPETGITPSFYWADAYVGGSCLRVTGSTSDEYLHLFKTSYALQPGDVITFRYKLVAGKADIDLVFSVEGAESNVAKRFAVCTADQLNDDAEWVNRQYTVAAGDGLAGKTLAMIAMNFRNAVGMDIYAGEFSIKRGASPAPVKPNAPSVTILRNTYSGIDAKIIFDVPNDKPEGTVCYNSDVNTSMFKFYAQEEGEEPILMGATTSWAAMSYSTPFKGDESGMGRIRFGVSAVSLDTDSESDIAWSEYKNSVERSFSDVIQVSKSTITPDEDFVLYTVDAKREFHWAIVPNGVDNAEPVAESAGMTNSWDCEGISEIGTYDLILTGPNNTDNDTNATITHTGFIVVTDPARGRIPEIQTITANGKEADISIEKGDEVTFNYTGRTADGSCSRGIAIEEQFFGVRAGDVLDNETTSFSVSGWMKIDEFPAAVNFVDIVKKDGAWPRNNWGFLWSSINQDGTLQNYDQDYSAAASGATTEVIRYDFGNGKTRIFNKGQWTHFAMVFDRNADEKKVRTMLYINGQRVESTWTYYYPCQDYDWNMRVNSTGTTEDYINAFRNLDLDNYIIVGGTRHTGRGHGGSGFTGALDEFQVWNKAMTEEDVKASMAGLDPNNLPEGLAGYWDFEDVPGSDNKYIAKGSKAGATAGYFILNPDPKNEGRSEYVFIRPVAGTGCPFIEGTNYKITTTPSWKARLSDVVESAGTDTEGSAKIRFNREGEDYTAELTLSNDLGSHSRTFQFIKVGGPGAINEVAADADMRTYVVDDVLYLDVATDGFYTVYIYDVNGRVVANKSADVNAGDFMKLTINGNAGVYLVSVVKDGESTKNFKVVKR